MEKEKSNSVEKTAKFVEKYWPVLVVGGTVVGATVWLVTRHIKNKKSENTKEYDALTQLENEALSTKNETAVLLETGTQLTKIAGAEIETAINELSEHLSDSKAKSTLNVLKNLASMESNKQKK
jgi:hypothetical protein